MLPESAATDSKEVSVMGGEVSGNDDSVSGSEEDGGRNMAWLTGKGYEEKADSGDVDIPHLPSIEDSHFEVEMRILRKTRMS